MQIYHGSGLTPLFHSEITSSYLLYDLIAAHPQVVSTLMRETFGVEPSDIKVQREHSYPKKGSIDVFVEFSAGGARNALLIEVKVHDYLSAGDGQILTYYHAAVDDGQYAVVYFLYLTQFTTETDFTSCTTPRTLDEARSGRETIGEHFAHLSWHHMYTLLSRFEGSFSTEQQVMLDLQRQWMRQQCAADLENNKIEVGMRALEDYFVDIPHDIRESLPFGNANFENKRHIWRINCTGLDGERLDTLFTVIRTYCASDCVNQLKSYKTEDSTLRAAQEFLAQLALENDRWELLAFYASLFTFLQKSCYVKFNGTGTRGFSIKVDILNKGEISLCTLYRNKTIEFSMKR